MPVTPPTPTPYLFTVGSTFAVSTDSGSSWITVGGTKSVTPSGQKRNFSDTTNLGSAGGYMESAPTLKDPGQVAVAGVFDQHDAGQIALQAAYDAGTLLLCKETLTLQGTDTTGATREYFGFVQEPLTFPVNGEIAQFSASIKITGQIIFTAGTPAS